MKRSTLLALTLGLMMVLVISGAALAQDTTTPAPVAGACGANFVDADGDGVCDNAGAGVGAMNGQRSAMRGQGMRGTGLQGTGVGNGTNGTFVDANGDGQCDTFVDADGDGVNDNAPQDGTGRQIGRTGGMGRMGGAGRMGH
jgi:hypothetical protein